MSTFRFTRSAREDLVGVWLYSSERWNQDQADRYQDAIFACCERVADRRAPWRPVPIAGSVYVHHCQSHYLFFVEAENATVFIAVLHERMDLIARLRERR